MGSKWGLCCSFCWHCRLHLMRQVTRLCRVRTLTEATLIIPHITTATIITTTIILMFTFIVYTFFTIITTTITVAAGATSNSLVRAVPSPALLSVQLFSVLPLELLCGSATARACRWTPTRSNQAITRIQCGGHDGRDFGDCDGDGDGDGGGAY